jgi:glycosyltransferase involved in cell wall biosynthesis
MKLLIVTQKVDRADPILGFFHGWIAALAERCDRVTVLGQSVGAHALPSNVRVVSLGKERGASRPFQVLRFWRLLWSLRRDYDTVLVHMTPIWVVVGSPLWKALRKQVFLWYEARGARWPLRLALHCVRKVFSASPAGMPIVTGKSIVVGHGIATDLFRPGEEEREEGLLVTVGRVTQAKRLDVIVDCLAKLPFSFHLVMVGLPVTREDRGTLQRLQTLIHGSGLMDRVTIEALPQRDVVRLLQRGQVFLHASRTALDKALLEAMACGCLVVSCAEAARSILPDPCIVTPEGMAQRVQALAALPPPEQRALREELRNRVLRDHSLVKLAERLVREMEAL